MSNAYVTSGECNQRGNALLDSLRDNDPMFRLLFERCADAIWLFDPERQVVLDCNEAAVQLMRCQSKEQLLCAGPGEWAPTCQADGRCSKLVASEMNRIVHEQGSHRFEWIARRFDGTDVPLEVLITPVHCNGHELHVVFSRDISERKKAETALQDNQRLLISIADNISDAVYRTGPNQELVFVNRAYLQMFGYDSLDELRAIPRENLYGKAEDRRHILGVIEHFGGFRDMEVQYKRKDGALFWGLVTSVAVRNSESGRVEYHVGSIRDITQRKEGETEIRRLNTTLEERVAMRTAELSASEERLRTLIEHAPDAIVVLDGLSGQFVTCNENAATLYGRPREQLLKVAPWDLSPDRQPNGSCSTEAARQWIQKAVDGQAPVFEWTHKHSSGRLVPCEVRLVRLPGDGRPLIRGSVIDNTERKRREAIQQATYQISEAVHTVEDLESLYSRIHQIVQGLMPAKNFYIALLDPATETISFPYYVDQRAAENPGARPLGTGLTGLVLRTGKPLLLDTAMEARKRKTGDAVTFEGMGDISYIESGHQAAIWLGVPLMAGGKPFGVMAVQDYNDPHAYGEEEKRILTFVAGQTALAIGRKRSEQALRDRTERALRHRSVLLTLAQMDKADLSNAMEQICALSAATFETARVSYWSMSQDRAVITCELLYDRQTGRAVPEAKGTRLGGDKCPAYFAALRNHEPIIAHDAQTCGATRELADGYLRPLGITSMLDVPVWLEGKVIGVLCHEHIGPRREWQLEEIDFASSLATMVSLSIEAAQRARSENALRDSEQKFRTLFDSSGQGVMLHDERCFLEVNPAAVRILRYESAEQIIGKSPTQTSAPVQPCGQSALTLAQKHIDDCIKQGTTRFEWMAMSPKGETIPLDVILTSIRVGGRQIIQAVIDDISERKKAEQALQQRHREVVTLLDSLPGYAFFKDAQHRYVMANQNFCRAVGLTSDAIIGKDDFDLFPKELAEKYRADDAALLASGRPLFVGEEEMREPGRSFYVQTTKVPVRNEQGRVVGLIGLGFDITDRKKAEEELLRTLAREKELGELKSNFVSMVSHEFRTPLGIVMSSAEILRDYLDQLAADERQHHLLSITRSVRRMAELMEEVLVLGRLDAGKMAYNPAPIDLQVLSRRITDEVYSATERRCPINLLLDKSPTEVYADERLLRHILNNLLSNAVKYSEAGAPVDLTVEQSGCEAVFVVKDRGIGIPDEDKQWLFNAFQRGRNVGQRTGTGLGLVIVKRCVELHRGRIEIESKRGEGTRVTVGLPICPAGE